MKHKGLFFALGISMFLSCGIISFSGHDVVAKAEGTVDAGEISFSLYSSLAHFQNGIFLVGDRDNDIPTNWDGNMLAQDSNCVVRNGENIQAKLKKIPDYTNGYYLALSDTGYGTRSIGERIELQGHWTITADGTTYNLTVNKFYAFWSGNAWIEDFEWPELETYDKVSLAQAGFDDFDRVVINEDRVPEVDNTFALSEGNTTSSFAFEFVFESFGEKVDTIYNAKSNEKSVSFPRISPDGKYLAFTLHQFGNFSIWHKGADLWMQPTNTQQTSPIIKLTSPRADSYHTWSSTGKWVVFSSRRGDGLYTRPYIMHWDGKAFTKPFAVPQSTAIYDKKLLKSYNIPEFTTNAFTAMEALREAVNE